MRAHRANPRPFALRRTTKPSLRSVLSLKRLAVRLCGPVLAVTRRDWQICDTHADGRPCRVVPLSPGGALLFSGMLPHGTPTNRGEGQRLALQFHFKPRNAQMIDDAERLRLWGGEGRGVQC